MGKGKTLRKMKRAISGISAFLVALSSFQPLVSSAAVIDGDPANALS